MTVHDLGLMPYREAWIHQEEAHARVAAGGEETLLIVEHPSVITLGRRPDSIRNLVSSVQQLSQHHIDLVHSDRGGDITFHGPGQIVAYPIVRLADHSLSVSGYVHRLEAIVIAALAEMGIAARVDPQAVGVWTDDAGGGDGQADHAPADHAPADHAPAPAKICAIGVRIRRGVSLHGLALNVSNDLSGFTHIVPCGLNDRPVTSIGRLLGTGAPSIDHVKKVLAAHLIGAFTKK